MTDYHPNESEFMAWLVRNKAKNGFECIGQIECWGRKASGEYHFFEVKSQEAFEPPPFRGHGLPVWQVEKYLRMERDLGVIWHLVVLDIGDGVAYHQRLAVLDAGKSIETPRNPRRIYPLSAFKVLFDDWRAELLPLDKPGKRV